MSKIFAMKRMIFVKKIHRMKLFVDFIISRSLYV